MARTEFKSENCSLCKLHHPSMNNCTCSCHQDKNWTISEMEVNTYNYNSGEL